MNRIIDELWYGNVCPFEDSHKNTEEVKNLLRYISEHKTQLAETMTESQKAIFEKLGDCYAEYSDISEREVFSYAFSLGARIAIEVMSFDANE